MSCEVPKTDRQLNGAVDESMTEDHPWYSDTKYDRYWSHYKQMKAWMQGQQSVQDSVMNAWMLSYQQYLQHYQWWMYRSSWSGLSSPHQHQMHHPYYHSHPQSWHSLHPSRTHHHHSPYPPSHHHHQGGFHHHHHPYKPHPGTTSYRGNKQYTTDQSDVDYLDNGFSETAQEDEDEGGGGGGEEEEFEVELSEEMRQFFLQSQKHREELKELKLALNQKTRPEKTKDGDVLKEDTKQDETYADEFEMSFTSSKKSRKKHIIGAPVEQPGRRRAEEMKILYGKDSPAIHGMETAIQMQFDRNCDKKQPTFWPTVPLKM